MIWSKSNDWGASENRYCYPTIVDREKPGVQGDSRRFLVVVLARLSVEVFSRLCRRCMTRADRAIPHVLRGGVAATPPPKRTTRRRPTKKRRRTASILEARLGDPSVIELAARSTYQLFLTRRDRRLVSPLCRTALESASCAPFSCTRVRPQFHRSYSCSCLAPRRRRALCARHTHYVTHERLSRVSGVAA